MERPSRESSQWEWPRPVRRTSCASEFTASTSSEKENCPSSATLQGARGFHDYANTIVGNRWRAWLPDDLSEMHQSNVNPTPAGQQRQRDGLTIRPEWLLSMDSELAQQHSDVVIFEIPSEDTDNVDDISDSESTDAQVIQDTHRMSMVREIPFAICRDQVSNQMADSTETRAIRTSSSVPSLPNRKMSKHDQATNRFFENLYEDYQSRGGKIDREDQLRNLDAFERCLEEDNSQSSITRTTGLTTAQNEALNALTTDNPSTALELDRMRSTSEPPPATVPSEAPPPYTPYADDDCPVSRERSFAVDGRDFIINMHISCMRPRRGESVHIRISSREIP